MTYQDMDEPAEAVPDVPAGASATQPADKLSETKERAAVVAQTAQSAAKDVAAEAGTQAQAVVSEVRTQARDLLATTQTELKQQGQARTDRAAEGLRTLSAQVRALSEGRPDEAGRFADWAKEGQQRLAQWSDRLEQGGLDGLLSDLGGLARRRPMAFLGGCLGAGFLLGRLVKAAADDGSSRTGSHNGLAAPAGPPVAAAGLTPSSAYGPGTDEMDPLPAMPVGMPAEGAR